jgi:two-component system, cell cycle sensor histidine kinase and response regulator CckA
MKNMKIIQSPAYTARLNGSSLTCPYEQIQAEIEAKLGFFPPFFSPAIETPQVLENLWQQTLSAYLNNPLPTVFKEKLSAYLSRFCAVPYCMICHSCSLYELGVEAYEVLQLLEKKLPTSEDFERNLQNLANYSDVPISFVELDAELEACLLNCAIYIAAQPDRIEWSQRELRNVLGANNYQFLMVFIAYVKTCHTWMEAHPEIAYQDDRRVQDSFQSLIEDHPGLADFFINYRERVRRDRQTWMEQQAVLAERQRHEAALQKIAEENLYLARAVASVSEGIIITDPHQPENPIIYANPAFLRITGYELEEVLGRNCRFLQGEQTDRAVVQQIRQAIAERREITTTLLNYQKQGQPFWNELRIAPVFSETNDLLYFVGIQTDVSDRIRAEVALRESEERFHLIAQATNDAIWDWNLATDTIWWNEGIQILFGFAPSDVGINANWWFNHIHPDDRERVATHIQTVIQGTDLSWADEYYFCKANHEYAYVFERGYIIRDDSGKAIRMIGGMMDITDRKRAEEALEQQAEMLHKQAQLLELAHDAILVRNMHNQITFWNPSAEATYGWTQAEVLGKDSYAYLNTQSSQPSQSLQAIESELLKKNYWEGELIHKKRDASQITVMSRWALQRDKDGNPIAILEMNQDITEKKALESQVLRAQRMESIGTLAGGIAHDLNNVLTPILSSAQLLLMQTSDENVKAKQLLETIQSSARRGAALLRQVLSFARGVAGKRTILQVRHLIAEIQQMVQETFPKSIDLHLDLANDLWLVSADATQLHQVLMNLCMNARDAMPDGGTLSVSASNIWIDEQYARMNLDAKVGAYVVITVTDTGVGIPPERLDRIFEPFFTTKELGKGTGLGLSTALGIVRSHDGFVTVSSSVAKGTQFKTYLPAVAAEEAQPQLEEDSTWGHGELILVVDDETAIRETNQASLEAYNYRAITAIDGIDAIALYVKHRQEVDLVLIDLMMPSMDGTTAIRALRKINPDIKIVAVSGLITESQVTTPNHLAIQGFLPKPYTAKELAKCIAGVLQSK